MKRGTLVKCSAMLVLCSLVAVSVFTSDTPETEEPATALHIIDIQDFYFPGGNVPLVAPEAAAENAAQVLASLRELGVERLVLVGMQTHMYLEAATRAAHDLGFECVVIGDACATRDLTYGDTTVKAADVHASTLATLDRTYAKVVDTEAFLSEK